MNKHQAVQLILAERKRQDELWPRDEHPLVKQYEFYAPHLVLLKRYADKAIEHWTVSVDETELQRDIVKIAAIALRALEEVVHGA